MKKSLLALLAVSGCAFSVQNGVGKNFALLGHWGHAHVAGAISMIGGEGTTANDAPDGPLDVRYDMAAPTLLGALESDGPDVPSIVDALRDANLAAEVRADIVSVEWSKVVGWSGVSALAALTRLPTATVLSAPETALIAARVMRETATVAGALGIDLDPTGMARAEVLQGTEAEAPNAPAKPEGSPLGGSYDHSPAQPRRAVVLSAMGDPVSATGS